MTTAAAMSVGVTSLALPLGGPAAGALRAGRTHDPKCHHNRVAPTRPDRGTQAGPNSSATATANTDRPEAR